MFFRRVLGRRSGSCSDLALLHGSGQRLRGSALLERTRGSGGLVPLVKKVWRSLHQVKEFLVPRSIFRGRCVRNGTVTEGLGATKGSSCLFLLSDVHI